ncbi:uncharacterized protein LOC143180427 [Calliopsis andreniformis]|uniref:uncharacterized protein LOC143180427 n=1 Tax=Calliopsis andreniformis TaxID=337506 RepID=UPI003FCE1690
MFKMKLMIILLSIFLIGALARPGDSTEKTGSKEGSNELTTKSPGSKESTDAGTGGSKESTDSGSGGSNESNSSSAEGSTVDTSCEDDQNSGGSGQATTGSSTGTGSGSGGGSSSGSSSENVSGSSPNSGSGESNESSKPSSTLVLPNVGEKLGHFISNQPWPLKNINDNISNISSYPLATLEKNMPSTPSIFHTLLQHNPLSVISRTSVFRHMWKLISSILAVPHKVITFVFCRLSDVSRSIMTTMSSSKKLLLKYVP